MIISSNRVEHKKAMTSMAMSTITIKTSLPAATTRMDALTKSAQKREITVSMMLYRMALRTAATSRPSMCRVSTSEECKKRLWGMMVAPTMPVVFRYGDVLFRNERMCLYFKCVSSLIQ